MTSKLLPQIRFSDFSDAWEQLKLGDLGNTYTGISGKTSVDFGHGDARFITYMNVYTNPVANPEMVDCVEVDRKQHEVEAGDVFFTTSSETPDEVGLSSVLLEKQGIVYLNSFCFGYRPKVKIDLHYLAFMLRSEVVRKKIVFLAQGISRYNISKNKMMDISVPLPSLEEQSKIGCLFNNLDNLITLYQRKCEKLKLIKKSMLEKMFPKKGKNFPKIRFKGFTDAWERRKLSELGEIVTGTTPSTSKSEYYSDTGIPWVTPTDIESNVISKTQKKLSEAGAKVGRIVPANTILCTCIASIGKNALLMEKGSFNQQINSLTPNANNDAYFLLTESEIWSNQMKRMAALGTMQIVNKSEFSELVTMVPKFEEQKKIGSFFSCLDNLITLHQCKCEMLKNVKKSMLQMMFV